MEIKVCGMKYPSNIQEVVKLEPDLLGFIFYSGSKRFVGEDFSPHILKNIPVNIKKTGVFVNEKVERLLRIHQKYSLDYLQLHGEESPEQCELLKKEGCRIIKVFSVDNSFDFNTLSHYESFIDHFLFDTKGENYGGNGIAFNWNILNQYNSKIPFILSGGVSLDNIDHISQSNFKKLYAIDVNSKFEVSPGVKDISKLKQLFKSIREERTAM